VGLLLVGVLAFHACGVSDRATRDIDGEIQGPAGPWTGVYDGLKNPGLLLEPADVFYDLFDVIRFHGVNLRHVAELPMVRLDAVGRSSLEGRVAMVIGLIDFVHKRRTLLGADAPGSVAS